MAKEMKDSAAEQVEMMRIMASTAEKLKNEPKKKIMLPLDNEKQADVFVAINGYSYQIARGEEVEVPESVYNVLIQSQKQDQLSMKRSRELSERAKKMK